MNKLWRQVVKNILKRTKGKMHSTIALHVLLASSTFLSHLRRWQTRTHCCRHKCFPVCPRAQHLLRTQNLCPRNKNVSDFFQKHFVSATNVSRFAQHRNNNEQQCVRNIVSSFDTTFMQTKKTQNYKILAFGMKIFVKLTMISTVESQQ